MDNVTHTLFGATLARTGLGRGRGTTMALVLASNAPDIDIVATAGGTLKYLEWHRGPTHGPLGIIGLGLATAALVCGGRLLLDRRRRGGTTSPAVRNATFGELVLISVLGVLCHVLMDLPTSYGSRLLSPFDWHWYAFDWMPIIDIYLLGALGAGLLIGQRWRSARRRNAVLVLIFMTANYGARFIAHERAVAAAPHVFGPALPARCEGAPNRGLLDRWPVPSVTLPDASARCLIELAALPDFGSLFRWRLVAKLSNAYLVRDVDILDTRLRAPSSSDALWRLTITYPNQWTPQVFQAASADAARVFLGFSRFPTVRWVVDPAGVTTVSWRDLRFAAPGPRRVSNRLEPDRERPEPNLFGATVRVDSSGEIIEARLGAGN